MSYTMQVSDDAIIIMGNVPIDDLTGPIQKLAKMRKIDLMDFGLPNALGASFVLCSKAGRDRLRAEVDKEDAFLPPLAKWVKGYDTGISSKVIAHALGGLPRSIREVGVPHDSDDFGRCIRLVRLMGWQDRLGEVATRYPTWEPIVAKWDALCAAFDANDHKEVYRLLDEKRP